MGSSRMPVLLKSLQKETGYPDRIEGWLEKLESKGPETDESEDDQTTRIEIRALEPTTPTRQTNPRSTSDEVSPTDTTLSGQSIFDRPLRKNLFGSPTPRCEIRDDGSDATSIRSDDWEPTPKNERPLERLVPPNFSLPPGASSASLDSHDSASDALTDELTVIPSPNTKPVLLTQGPNEPRPVWITSCLQCTLAGLPCSRTYPHCSRCRRKGDAEDCLLQRRCFVSEALNSSPMDICKTPTLLKVKGDDEGLWKRKVELAEELCGKWIAEQEKKNWILPDIDSPRGGWRTRKDNIKREKMSHPGEGTGRLSFRELFVDMND